MFVIGKWHLLRTALNLAEKKNNIQVLTQTVAMLVNERNTFVTSQRNAEHWDILEQVFLKRVFWYRDVVSKFIIEYVLIYLFILLNNVFAFFFLLSCLFDHNHPPFILFHSLSLLSVEWRLTEVTYKRGYMELILKVPDLNTWSRQNLQELSIFTTT